VTDLSAEARMMLQILALDAEACLKFSDYTQQWYIASRIEKTNGSILTGMVEHRDTPTQAVLAFHGALTDIDRDHVLVTDAGRETRRHWRWNGGAFVEVRDFLLPWNLYAKAEQWGSS
jgi:hypothetical protein